MQDFHSAQLFLILNAGSSSIKFQLFSRSEQKYKVICKGLAERIAVDGNLVINFAGKKNSSKQHFPDHSTAINKILEELQRQTIIKNFDDITAIGHRVVHGGKNFVQPTVVTKAVIAELIKIQKLAPLHNPGSLAVIQALQKRSDLPSVLVFDTAFHSTIPTLNAIYPVPYEWYKENDVQKYGFHGISYEYIVKRLQQLESTKSQNINAVICHLGNGSSVAAIENSKSINTTMGFTPLAGLMMGTRCGDIDCSIVPHINDERGLSLSEISSILNKKSGLLAISGVSSDMREIEDKAGLGNARCQLALDLYSQRVADYIVKYANLLKGKMQYLVFTAGIGENSPIVVKNIIKRLHILPLNFKKDLFAGKATSKTDYFFLTEKETAVTALIMSTNEELIICQAAAQLKTKKS